MALPVKGIAGLLCLFFILVVAASAVAAEGEEERVVYIAQDLSTYLYAISLWDKDIQFPVFIGEGRFLDSFLKGYPGARIEKLERRRVGTINRALVYRALYAAWGPETLDDAPREITREALKARLKSLGVVPEGVVVTNVSDAEFAGGFALAAGRCQPIVFFTSPVKRSLEVSVWNNSVTELAKEKIRTEILDGVKDWGYPYEGLGEGIDYVTLAFNMPHAYRRETPAAKNKIDPGYSMTDAIGRLTPSGLVEEGVPVEGAAPGEPAVYAYCGQLIEAAPQMALFQAMSSLFAETDKALYFHRWQSLHGLEGVKGYQVLRTVVHTINRDPYAKPQARLKEWHRLTDGGHGFGFIHLTAAGDAYGWFDGKVKDIPEGRPCAVYFPQSGSTANPAVTDTLAGRWLLNGAYVYYGAASEPFAPSFNAAQTVAQTLAAGEPFGKAFQRKDTLPPNFRKAWRLVYVGDPLARPRFVEDLDEPAWSRTWRRGVALARRAECREAFKLLETVFVRVPAERAGELWRDLLRTYELTVGIETWQGAEPERLFVPAFIDGWMLPENVAKHRPEMGWRARLHVRMVKDVELANLLTARAGLDEVPDALKERLREEIERLDASAVFAKMWLVLGPLKWEHPEAVPREFPAEVAEKKPGYAGADGPVRWTLGLVEADTYTVALPRARSSPNALSIVVTMVYVAGGEPLEAVLKPVGEAASAASPRVWVNHDVVEPQPSSTERRVTLRPGVNEIVVRLASGRSGPEALTFGIKLTKPDGSRSKALAYIDLIKHLGIQGPPPGEGQ